MNDKRLILTMLGTGNATVTKCYNTCFVLQENEDCFLVDAGGGNQILSILEKQGISLNQIHDLFITHSHSDHILGVVWIVRIIGQMMRKKEYEGELRIYAPEQVIDDLLAICNIVLMAKVTDYFGNRIQLLKLQDGDEHTILGRKVTFFDIKSTKLLQYGFEIKEESLLFCGDEPLKKELYSKGEGMKYMLHEAFCLDFECEKFKPHEKHHSTVKDACLLAEELKVQNLILMHTEDSHIEDRKRLYMAEGERFFTGKLFVPDDGESILIN